MRFPHRSNLKIALDTYGCRTNVADSSALARALVEGGFAVTATPGDADVVLVNSCTVTAGADRDVGKAVRRIRRMNPDAIVGVFGCLPKAYPEHHVLLEADFVVAGALPEPVIRSMLNAMGSPVMHGAPAKDTAGSVDVVMHCAPAKDIAGSMGVMHGAPAKDAAGSVNDAGTAEAAMLSKVETTETDLLKAAFFPLEHALSLSRANIKIAQGCDGKCTYCIVPTARGKPQSLHPDDIVSRILEAARAGYSEVVLTATNLARYGMDLDSSLTVVDLMDQIEAAAPKCRIRIGSLEPDPMVYPIVERIARSPIWCRHLHIAVQHCSDVVLGAMGRTGSFKEIESLLNNAAASVPDIGIGLDLIVGFPAESAEEFAVAARRLEHLPFTFLHVFAWSPRAGTDAANMAAENEPEEVKERSAYLRNMARRHQRAFAARFVGRTLPILVEHRRISKPASESPGGGESVQTRKGPLTGISDNYLRATLDGPDSLMGRVVDCRVRDIHEGVLVCETETDSQTVPA